MMLRDRDRKKLREAAMWLRWNTETNGAIGVQAEKKHLDFAAYLETPARTDLEEKEVAL